MKMFNLINYCQLINIMIFILLLVNNIQYLVYQTYSLFTTSSVNYRNNSLYTCTYIYIYLMIYISIHSFVTLCYYYKVMLILFLLDSYNCYNNKPITNGKKNYFILLDKNLIQQYQEMTIISFKTLNIITHLLVLLYNKHIVYQTRVVGKIENDISCINYYISVFFIYLLNSFFKYKLSDSY